MPSLQPLQHPPLVLNSPCPRPAPLPQHPNLSLRDRNSPAVLLPPVWEYPLRRPIPLLPQTHSSLLSSTAAIAHNGSHRNSSSDFWISTPTSLTFSYRAAASSKSFLYMRSAFPLMGVTFTQYMSPILGELGILQLYLSLHQLLPQPLYLFALLPEFTNVCSPRVGQSAHLVHDTGAL